MIYFPIFAMGWTVGFGMGVMLVHLLYEWWLRNKEVVR